MPTHYNAPRKTRRSSDYLHMSGRLTRRGTAGPGNGESMEENVATVDKPKGPVRIRVYVETPTGIDSDEVECDRAEWEAMTPGERTGWCADAAVHHQNNVCPSDFEVLGDDAGSELEEE